MVTRVILVPVWQDSMSRAGGGKIEAGLEITSGSVYTMYSDVELQMKLVDATAASWVGSPAINSFSGDCAVS